MDGIQRSMQLFLATECRGFAKKGTDGPQKFKTEHQKAMDVLAVAAGLLSKGKTTCLQNFQKLLQKHMAGTRQKSSTDQTKRKRNGNAPMGIFFIQLSTTEPTAVGAVHIALNMDTGQAKRHGCI